MGVYITVHVSLIYSKCIHADLYDTSICITNTTRYLNTYGGMDIYKLQFNKIKPFKKYICDIHNKIYMFVHINLHKRTGTSGLKTLSGEGTKTTSLVPTITSRGSKQEHFSPHNVGILGPEQQRVTFTCKSNGSLQFSSYVWRCKFLCL